MKNTTLYDFIRKLGLNSLYANVMEPFVKGILKSQQSNRKNYTSDVKADIESRKEKLSGIVEQKENAVLLKKALEFGARTQGRKRIVDLGLTSDLVAQKLIRIYTA